MAYISPIEKQALLAAHEALDELASCWHQDDPLWDEILLDIAVGLIRARAFLEAQGGYVA